MINPAYKRFQEAPIGRGSIKHFWNRPAMVPHRLVRQFKINKIREAAHVAR